MTTLFTVLLKAAGSYFTQQAEARVRVYSYYTSAWIVCSLIFAAGLITTLLECTTQYDFQGYIQNSATMNAGICMIVFPFLGGVYFLSRIRKHRKKSQIPMEQVITALLVEFIRPQPKRHHSN